MLGFETAGNAIAIAYDGEPILTTDPWIGDGAYFGSWTKDFEIPPEQLLAIKRARYHWFSHGHPDHLDFGSLPDLGHAKLLVSDHRNSRVLRALRDEGYDVEVLPDRRWRRLSKNVSVWSMANQNQDSILLIRIGDRLVIDTNDSPDFGASFHVRRMSGRFVAAYMLALHGWGGADMFNLFDPDGCPLTQVDRARRPIAPRAQRWAAKFGARYAIPFSSFHRFQRTDSVWANPLIPTPEAYLTDAVPNGPEVLPAFVRVDCVAGEVTPLNPSRNIVAPKTPEECGDNWSDDLEAEDRTRITRYFTERAHLAAHFGFVAVRCGATEHRVELDPARKSVGVTFHAPRNSLMTCIREEIFDDMLIGNFMKTTMHGVESLYPHFTPYVAKYGDNGGAKSRGELARYFGHYIMRDPIGFAMTAFATETEQVVRRLLPEGTPAFGAAKRRYYAHIYRPRPKA